MRTLIAAVGLLGLALVAGCGSDSGENGGSKTQRLESYDQLTLEWTEGTFFPVDTECGANHVNKFDVDAGTKTLTWSYCGTQALMDDIARTRILEGSRVLNEDEQASIKSALSNVGP